EGVGTLAPDSLSSTIMRWRLGSRQAFVRKLDTSGSSISTSSPAMLRARPRITDEQMGTCNEIACEPAADPAAGALCRRGSRPDTLRPRPPRGSDDREAAPAPRAAQRSGQWTHQSDPDQTRLPAGRPPAQP